MSCSCDGPFEPGRIYWCEEHRTEIWVGSLTRLITDEEEAVLYNQGRSLFDGW